MNIDIVQTVISDDDMNVQKFSTPYLISDLRELYEDITNRAKNSIVYYEHLNPDKKYLLEVEEKKDGLPLASVYCENIVIEQVYGTYTE